MSCRISVPGILHQDERTRNTSRVQGRRHAEAPICKDNRFRKRHRNTLPETFPVIVCNGVSFRDMFRPSRFGRVEAVHVDSIAANSRKMFSRIRANLVTEVLGIP